ncbi:glycosyltransferase family 4 protein [Candidatus Curtissbacteria bacterium]|nr:glycosyltransferase family 4 protein [Candidatus Curtissbacteria bacterium]
MSKQNNIGVFLAIGESLTDLKQKGQLDRLIAYNIKAYKKSFNKVYIFSYCNEDLVLPNNCYLIPNKYNMHRFFYALLLPFVNKNVIEKCDVSRGLQITGAIPAAISKILYGIPYVVNYGYNYSDFAKMEGKNLQAFLFKLIKYPLLKFADNVIITTSSLKNQIKYVKFSKIHLIPNGVDLKLFKIAKSKENSELNIVYLGRLEEQKNLKNLIKACSLLKFRYKLTIFGNGTLKNDLTSLAKSLKVNLSIQPPVTYSQIPDIFTKSDIFTLVSYKEGNPKILIEAMACGKAIVASRVEGIKELIKNNESGLLTSTSDFDISKALVKLKSKTTREKLGKKARFFVAQNFDIEKLLALETTLLKTTVR